MSLALQLAVTYELVVQKDRACTYVMIGELGTDMLCHSTCVNYTLQLQKQFSSLQSDLLPPKKAFGNTTEEFVEKRQQQLELYLQHLVHSLQPHPKELLDFLTYRLIVSVVQQAVCSDTAVTSSW